MLDVNNQSIGSWRSSIGVNIRNLFVTIIGTPNTFCLLYAPPPLPHESKEAWTCTSPPSQSGVGSLSKHADRRVL